MEYQGDIESIMNLDVLAELAIKVTSQLRSPNPRIITRFVECGTGGKKMVFHNSVNNLHAAILGRVYFVKDGGEFKKPPVPRDLKPFKKFLRKLRHKVNYGGRMSYFDYANTRAGPKKQAYLREVETLHERIITWRDELAKFFIKDELMALEPDGLGGWIYKTPRVIRPQSVVINLLLGVHIAPLEKAVYRALDRCLARNSNVRRTVTKAMNVVQIGETIKEKWDQFDDPICVQLDCSRFSQHVSVGIHDAITDFLVSVPGESTDEGKDLRKQMNRARTVRWVAKARDGALRGEVTGTLSDGVVFTSLFGVLTMCAMVDDACTRAGIKREMFSAGDDTNIICEKIHWALIKPHLEQVAADYGFNIKVEGTSSTIEGITFCRMQPVFDGATWRMVREPLDSMTRDGMTVKPVPNEAIWDELRAAKAHCGTALTSGMPVLQAFYDMLGRGTTGFKESRIDQHSGMVRMSKGLESKQNFVSDEARLSFFRAFGIDPERQIALEEFYGTLRPSYSRRCERLFLDTFEETTFRK